MKKSDIGLILTIFIVNSLFLFKVISLNDALSANVYYESNLVMQIDLSKNAVYTVDGTNGEVEITVKDGKVAITKETSPLNICSKQGYVNVNTIPLVCLPNSVVVEGSDSEVDGVAR